LLPFCRQLPSVRKREAWWADRLVFAAPEVITNGTPGSFTAEIAISGQLAATLSFQWGFVTVESDYQALVMLDGTVIEEIAVSCIALPIAGMDCIPVPSQIYFRNPPRSKTPPMSGFGVFQLGPYDFTWGQPFDLELGLRAPTSFDSTAQTSGTSSAIGTLGNTLVWSGVVQRFDNAAALGPPFPLRVRRFTGARGRLARDGAIAGAGTFALGGRSLGCADRPGRHAGIYSRFPCTPMNGPTHSSVDRGFRKDRGQRASQEVFMPLERYVLASLRLLIPFGFLLGLGFPARAATSTPIFLTGDAAPATGGTFGLFGPVVINDPGTLAFEGSVSTAGRGLWRHSAAGLTRVFALPTNAPGGPVGATLDFIDGLALPQTGDPVLVRLRLSTGEDALYSASSVAGLLPIAIEGQPAPGTTGAVFQSLRASLRVSDTGEAAFFAVLEGGDTTSTNATGVWAGGGGNLALLARQGDPAPGGGGETWFQMDQYPRIAPDETVGLASILFTIPGTSGVWTGTPAGGLSPAFITTDDTFYSGAVIGDAGHLVFTKSDALAGPPTLEAGLPGNFRTVIGEGDPAPGLQGGVGVVLAAPEPRINRTGQVAFRTATSDGVPREGIWSEGSGALELVALIGEPAPETGGLVYVEFLGFELNDLGQLAFLVEVGDSIDFPGDPALYLANPGATPELVALEQRFFSVGPGDVRQVRSLRASVESVGFLDEQERGALNHTGELVFSLTFFGPMGEAGGSGGGGIFVATVPEPKSALLSITALFTLGCLGWRSHSPRPT